MRKILRWLKSLRALWRTAEEVAPKTTERIEDKVEDIIDRKD